MHKSQPNSESESFCMSIEPMLKPPLCAAGDPLEQLVRHFLIETGPRGVKIKGCQNESYFGW